MAIHVWSSLQDWFVLVDPWVTLGKYLFGQELFRTTTDWGIRVWTKWADSRATTKEKYSYCFVELTLFMNLMPEKKCIICLLHTYM